MTVRIGHSDTLGNARHRSNAGAKYEIINRSAQHERELKPGLALHPYRRPEGNRVVSHRSDRARISLRAISHSPVSAPAGP